MLDGFDLTIPAGTSLAIDPDTGLVVILLTNRIHPDADNFLLEAYRPRFHNIVASSLSA